MTGGAANGFLPEDRMSARQALLWTAAAAVVVGVHAGGVVLALQPPPEVAASEAPPAAVMIELAPATVSPDLAEPSVTPDLVDSEEVLETAPDLPEPPEPAPIELPPEVKPAVVVEERPPTRPPERPKPETPEKEKKPQEKPPAEARRRAAVEAPAAETASASRTVTGGSGKGTPQAWQSRLVAHLERRKRYPPEARTRREEGAAMVFFRIDGDGRVISTRLVRSSGHPALDAAAVALVQRASPVPAPPPDAPQEITVPISYSVR